MAYISVSRARRWPNLFLGAILCVGAAACGDDPSAANGGSGGGGSGGRVPPGCIVQNFPEQPDVLIYPLMEARVVAPGGSVVFKVYVDRETRRVKATLMDAWRLDPTPPPQGMSEPEIQNTLGNEELAFSIPINTTGRYYAELELCGSDCDALRVVYTLNRANAGEMSDAINDPYERIVYQGDVETGTSFTCDHPDSVAVQ